MDTMPSPATLPDEALLCEAMRLASNEQQSTAALVRVLMEVDVRRLYLREGSASLFAWCVQVLHLEEGAAYNRIEVARAGHRLPAVLDAVDCGDISLTAARLLAPHLTAENHVGVLARARRHTIRDIQVLVAELAPKPDVPSSIRRLASTPLDPLPVAAEASPSSSGMPATVAATVSGGQMAVAEPDGVSREAVLVPSPAPGSRTKPAVAIPLSPARFLLQMTISQETHAKLRHAQNLLRPSMPGGDLAQIVDHALTVLVRELERQRLGSARAPRAPTRTSSSSRRIPAFVRRAVWQRDDGQCAFVGPHGRCRERAWLEFHHVVPYAVGGAASVENISLRCRAHNAHEGAVYFGERVMTTSRSHKAAEEPGGTPQP